MEARLPLRSREERELARALLERLVIFVVDVVRVDEAVLAVVLGNGSQIGEVLLVQGILLSLGEAALAFLLQHSFEVLLRALAAPRQQERAVHHLVALFVARTLAGAVAADLVRTRTLVAILFARVTRLD